MWRGIAAARLGGRVTDISHAVESYVRSQPPRRRQLRHPRGLHRPRHRHRDAPAAERAELRPPRPGSQAGARAGARRRADGDPGQQVHRPAEDDWTIVTDDGSWAAHFEHTFTLTAVRLLGAHRARRRRRRSSPSSAFPTAATERSALGGDERRVRGAASSARHTPFTTPKASASVSCQNTSFAMHHRMPTTPYPTSTRQPRRLPRSSETQGDGGRHVDGQEHGHERPAAQAGVGVLEEEAEVDRAVRRDQHQQRGEDGRRPTCHGPSARGADPAGMAARWRAGGGGAEHADLLKVGGSLSEDRLPPPVPSA